MVTYTFLQEVAVLKFKQDSIIKKIDNLYKFSVDLGTDYSVYNDFNVWFSELEPTYEDFSHCQLNSIKLLVTLDLSAYQPVIDQVDE